MRCPPRSAAQALAIALLSAALPVCCAKPPEPAAPAVEPDELQAEPEARTSEWLYATERVRGDRPEECQHVAEMLDREARCKGPLCAHSASLIKDYLLLCEGSTPQPRRAELERLWPELEKRAERRADACSQQAMEWLRDGCGKEGACRDQVQRWATLCGEKAATPLIVAMLEQLVEQSFRDRRAVHIDARSCATLSAEVRASATCKTFEECQRELPKIEAFTTRCSAGAAAPLALADALAIASVRLGAELPSDPLPLAKTPAAAQDSAGVLPLADGRGGIMRVCRARVTDLDSYLAARSQCSDGTVVMALRHDAGKLQQLRVVSLDHPNDATFARRFTSLFVIGERARRSAARVAELAKGLEEAAQLADSASTSAGLSRLAKTLSTVPAASLRTDELSKALAPYDRRLKPLCVALGVAKARAPGNRTSAMELVPFSRRAEAYPFADVTAEGRVELGFAAPGGLLPVATMLPNCASAYRSELVALEPKLKRTAPDINEASTWSARVLELTDACGSARAKALSLEDSLVRCGASIDTCDDATVERLEASLDKERVSHEDAWVRARLAVVSLPVGSRPAAETALRQKCPD